MELISAIRIIFHVPNWTLAIGRLHYFHCLSEQRCGWTASNIFNMICPGGEIFPFLMVFLYRASGGITLALLPSFFQNDSSTDAYFHLDITDNLWVAVAEVGIFLANAIGAKVLGHLMKAKGYYFSFFVVSLTFATLTSLLMIPHGNATLLAVRCFGALIFPSPVMLSRVTILTRDTYVDGYKYVPMVAALIWFNKGLLQNILFITFVKYTIYVMSLKKFYALSLCSCRILG